ncbi:hypothetical protein BsWGS_22397 [Bradybaena similaris]
MLSRLVYFLSGVYGGVVADQIYKKHKETWAPDQAWNRAKVRVGERILLWKTGHKPKPFASDNDRADENARTHTETLQSVKGSASVGEQGLEEQVRAMKDNAPEVKEIFEEKLKMWQVNVPEIKGIVKEKMNMLTEKAPVIEEMIEEKVKGFKDSVPGIKEKFHDKMKDLKDKTHEVKTVIRQKIKTGKQHADVSVEVISEKAKVSRDVSPGVKDIIQEEVKLLEDSVAKVEEKSEDNIKVLMEKIAEVDREIQEAENDLSGATRDFPEIEGKGNRFKVRSSKSQDILEAKRDAPQEKSPEQKEIIENIDVYNEKFPEFKETLKDNGGVFTQSSPKFKSIVDENVKGFNEHNSENNEAFNENFKCVQDTLSQKNIGKTEDKDGILKETSPEIKEMHEKESVFKENVSECPELLRQTTEAVVEIPFESKRKVEDGKPDNDEQQLAEMKKGNNENGRDVKKMITERMMRTLTKTAPDVTEILKGKFNALKNTFRGDDSTQEQKREPLDVPEIEPKNEAKVEPPTQPVDEPQSAPRHN